ncbi:hypothetical protein Tco_1401194 [Tanacetum coccineum]
MSYQVIKDHLANSHKMADAKEIVKPSNLDFVEMYESKKMQSVSIEEYKSEILRISFLLPVFENDVKGSIASSSITHCPQLDHEDLEQLDEFDLEEMELK